jgi:RNA-directed DNA polymerase
MPGQRVFGPSVEASLCARLGYSRFLSDLTPASPARALKEDLRRRRHLPMEELGKWLRSVVQGYFNYHAVPGNLASLRSFRLQVIRRWMRALRRRSQESRMTWPRLVAIAERWLPKPSIVHPYPNLRFDAKHPR